MHDKLLQLLNGDLKLAKEIESLFADEGYEKRTLGRDFTARVNMKEVMTGQSFYDRFVQALDDEFHQFSKPIGDEVNVAYDAINIHKAARKAAGLDQ